MQGTRPLFKLLTNACVRAISAISFYRESNVICAVPPSPDKAWDLPTEIVNRLSERTGKPDISELVSFTVPKQSVKATSLKEKWAALEAGDLSVNNGILEKKIILVDDKYQSGTTAQFVASKLYGAGAEEVNGLFCIKTWRDTDNQ
jgi:predicted amidophosphoribosyltransferase